MVNLNSHTLLLQAVFILMAPEHYIAIDIPHVRAEIAGRIMPLHDVLTQKLEAPTTTCGFIPSRQVSPSFYFAGSKDNARV